MSIYRPEDFGRKYTQPKGQKKVFRPGIVLDPKRAKKGTVRKDFFDFNRLKAKRNGTEMISLTRKSDSSGTPFVTIGNKREYFRKPMRSRQPTFGPATKGARSKTDHNITPVEPESKEARPTSFGPGQRGARGKTRDEDMREAMLRRVKRKAV